MNDEVTVHQVKDMQAAGADFIFLDVRLPQEKAVADIGGIIIPVQILSQELHQVPKNKKIIVYCHHGVRSQAAVEILRSRGFDAYSMTGGIDTWSREVDPKIARY